MNYFTIKEVEGLPIIDSRGNWTIRVYIETEGGIKSFGDAPSGLSRSTKEAIEIRDNDGTVNSAVSIVRRYIRPLIVGMDVREQSRIDKVMIDADGTGNKSRLGGNVITATSIATLKTASASLGLEPFQYIGGISNKNIPIPLLNIINGGLHAGSNLKIQEFLIIPLAFDTLYDALKSSILVYKKLKENIKNKYGSIYTSVGDEGGFVIPASTTEEALNILVRSIQDVGYKDEIKIGIDAAASNFYKSEKYEIDGKSLSAEDLLEFYLRLINEYPLLYIEDPFKEDSIELFAELQKNAKNIIITGDDLYSTNIKLLMEGIKRNATKGTIVKPNQIGTVTETIEYCKLAKENSIKIIISHRSGDTEDSIIADLAVGVGAEFIKTGAPARSERTSKYNRLFYLEKTYNMQYQGKKLFKV
ncbi:MAG: enolase [Sulfolobaceae archaeon]